MTVNRLVYIVDDGTIGINDNHLIGIDKKYFDWVPSNVHAVQWYGDQYGGDIEFKPDSPIGGIKPPNETITELGVWEQLVQIYNDEILRREESERVRLELIEASKNYWEIFRSIRNYKLLESDWTQLPNAPLTEEKKQEWYTYRQSLRDLTNIITDPKPLVNAIEKGEIHPDWPVPPQ